MFYPNQMNDTTTIIRFQPNHKDFDEDEGEWYPVDEHGRVYRYIWDDVENDDRQDLIRIKIRCKSIPSCAFRQCKNLETVIMEDVVEEIGMSAFINCESLVHVKLSTNIKYIGMGAFEGCKSLPSITIPESCQDIGDWAFRDCTSLTALSLPSTTDLGSHVFLGCTKLHLPRNVPS